MVSASSCSTGSHEPKSQKPGQSKFAWCVLAIGSSMLLAAPHVIYTVEGIAIALSLVCYGPFLLFLYRQSPKSSIALGSAYGLALFLIASGWVWSYPNLSLGVILLIGSVSIITCAISCMLAALTVSMVPDRYPALGLCLCALVLVAMEYFRSTSPHIFLPLGSIAQGAAYPALLPVSSILGSSGYGLFVLLVNIAIWSLALPRLITRNRTSSSALLPILMLFGLGLFAVFASAVTTEDMLDARSDNLEADKVCGISDKKRRFRKSQGYLTAEELNLILIENPNLADCDLLAFPEYTSLVARDTPLSDTTPVLKGKEIVVGVLMGDKIRDRMLETKTDVTNSVCVAHLSEKNISCVDHTDKKYLAPFVESNLFHQYPPLKNFGAWLTYLLVGEGNLATYNVPKGWLDIANFGSVGVLTCLELFIPDLAYRVTSRSPDTPRIIVAPTDLSSFEASSLILIQYKRAAALQAATAQTPLLFVATEEVVFFSSTGREIRPTHVYDDIHIWDT